MNIGILALQGGFTEIYEILKNIQVIKSYYSTDKKNYTSINVSFIKGKTDLLDIDAFN